MKQINNSPEKIELSLSITFDTVIPNSEDEGWRDITFGELMDKLEKIKQDLSKLNHTSPVEYEVNEDTFTVFYSRLETDKEFKERQNKLREQEEEKKSEKMKQLQALAEELNVKIN